MNALNGSVLSNATVLTLDGRMNMYNAAVGIDALLGSGLLNLDTTELTLNSGTFSGAINGTGSLVKVSADILTLSGASGYTGSTRVDDGLWR